MAAHHHSRYSPRTALAFSLAALVAFGLSSATGVSLAGASNANGNANGNASNGPNANANAQADRQGHPDGHGRASAAGQPANADREGNAGPRAESGGADDGRGAADSPAAHGHGDAPRGRSEEPARRDADGADKRQSGRETGADLTQPQPGSKADFSGNGANNHGAYDSTRDGSPSGNGNGGGEARGKPCAGCVGKADNKNPPGQRPDGSDHNNGYECDGNHGVGRTNPAHTGCRSTSTPPPPPCVPSAANPCGARTDKPKPPACVPSATDPCVTRTDKTAPPACVPTATDPCVASTTASSQACVPSPGNPCADVEREPVSRLAVLGTTIERPFSPLGPDGPRARVLGTTVERAGAALVEGRLARTGTGALEMAAIGLGMLLAGAALTRVNRRRPAGA